MKRKYNWYAIYNDNTRLSEEADSFEAIDNTKLKEFGLYGNNMLIYYDSNNTFHIGDHEVSFIFKNKLNPNKNFTYVSPVTFKEAYTDFSITRTKNKIYIDQSNVSSNINKYFIGYKSKTNDFVFQPLFVVDTKNCELYFEIKVSGKYEGNITMKINDKEKTSSFIKLDGNSQTFKINF